ncbi:hypothetical protein UC34_06085 [Pandoraea vervacti]|jgi:hypothetical protein|uniref:Uncharacterized protein n=3 Tax=Pandoraea TaxID=93217 RepID=A0A5E5A8I9_9BURK|nr:hypothetical protein [Pandoraea vervacti]AJP56675.1 hypothetical protein UC34_06085 [Pandoraea vervacti]VVE69478.1 hypothetical protein PCA31118_03231 [Pandoraea captiosa]
MTKVEAILPTLATREDLAREIVAVRVEMHQGFAAVHRELHKELHALTWRLIGTMVSVGAALVAATHFVAKLA